MYAAMELAIADRSREGSTARRVEEALTRAIVSMALPPGVRISEQEIAVRFGVSRQPVREAVIALAALQLLEVQPQRGTVVAKLSVDKMLQARFVREAIETAVVRRAAASFLPRSRERLDDLIALQHRAASHNDHSAFQRADHHFHATLADGAGCALAWHAIRGVKMHMDRICTLTLPDAEAMRALIVQHQAVLAAIDARNARAAQTAMRAHLTEVVRALPRIEREHPELFDAATRQDCGPDRLPGPHRSARSAPRTVA